MLGEALNYLRMAWALHRHLRTPLDPDPEQTVRHFLENRSSNFLSHAEKVLADPAHPYSQLFRIAGCSYADLESSVREIGLEPTLEALAREGIYVTHDESRGTKEIVRGGRQIPATPASWLNELGKGFLASRSGGTSGRPLETAINSRQLLHRECLSLLLIRELDLANRVAVNLGPILPGFGLLAAVMANRMKIGFDRWYPIGGATRGNLHYRIVTRYLVAQMRLFGAKVPDPIPLQSNDFRPAAEYLAQVQSQGQSTVAVGYVSAVTRLAAAALDHGLDVAGCRAIVGGEPLTDAKRRVIESAGVQAYATYGASDFGLIGYPCRHMHGGNRVHVFREAAAIVSRRRETGRSDPVSDSLYLTSLLPFAPRIFINMEIGDTGIVEQASCDCLFTKLGFDLELRDIAAFNKVTAQGMSIATDDLAHLFEEALPARFGGLPGDYQLLEVEGSSQTDVVLRIRPGVTAAAPSEILRFFLAETRRLRGGSLSALSWLHSNGIRVEFGEPVLGEKAKFRSIRLLGPGLASDRQGRPK